MSVEAANPVRAAGSAVFCPKYFFAALAGGMGRQIERAGKHMQIYESRSPEDTLRLGRELAQKAQPGDVIALAGDLGAGKTVFTKGFAEGLGIEEPVNSPTFTILQIYEEGRIPLYHFDVYRIEDAEEMVEVGLDEYLEGNGVCLIEWAGRIADLLPVRTIIVRIEKDLQKGVDYRRVMIDRAG
jgi:tRNA threonylcarbamoyladenosine biosynthesis protein TsaE